MTKFENTAILHSIENLSRIVSDDILKNDLITAINNWYDREIKKMPAPNDDELALVKDHKTYKAIFNYRERHNKEFDAAITKRMFDKINC